MTTPSERAVKAAEELYSQLIRSTGPTRDIDLMGVALDTFAADAVRVEREACAQLADLMVLQSHSYAIAAAIRARSSASGEET